MFQPNQLQPLMISGIDNPLGLFSQLIEVLKFCFGMILMINEKRIHNFLIFTLFSICAFLVMRGLNFQTSHDDLWFQVNYVKFDSISHWLLHRYNTWSGRVLIELVLPNVLRADVWLWRVLNILFFLLLTIGIYFIGANSKKSISVSNQWVIGGAVLALLMIGNRHVLKSGMFWATGSMNYLWPTACLCIALLPFTLLLTGKRVNNVAWGTIFLPAIYASYQEQTGSVLVIFAILSLIIYRLRYQKWCIGGMIITLIVILNFSILISAPGNLIRMQQEIGRFYPHFNSLSFSSKALQGYNYTLLNHCFYDSYKPFLILIGLTAYLGTTIDNKKMKIIAFFPLFYMLLSLIIGRGIGGEAAHIFNYDIYSTETVKTGEATFTLHFIPLVLGGLSILAIPLSWFYVFKLSPTFFKLVLFYFAGLFSSLVISFSPTIFASGHRVFFVLDIMIIIVILLLYAAATEHLNRKSKIFITCYSFLIITAASEFLKLI